MLDRRSFLTIGAGTVAAALLSTRSVFASIPVDRRLVFVFLRGGLDALHTLIPYGDADWEKLRPTLARSLQAGGGALDLDGYFGLHHALVPLAPLYRSGELLLIPAASTSYRDRSHFDGQNLLENGSGKPYGAPTGWLNRAIAGLNDGDRRLGLSIGPAVPLIMQGDARVQTWADSALPRVDEDFLVRMSRAYREDTLFLNALDDAREASQPDIDMAGVDNRRGDNFPLSARAVADLLTQPNGPRIAVMELGGWDTHFDQERRLTNLFGSLSKGIVELKHGLGKNWANTAVVIVSEFGRTAAENGSRGTDHGTGGLAMLAGGAVAGGRIAGDWPGLSEKALWQGRDLRSVNSYEALFKTIVTDHLGLKRDLVEDLVFPGSRSVQPMDGVLRRS